ncbi:type I DNA topoisomerase [Pseudaquidulcibacter saccharophilus]|uniref:type I DNA topoisomerase n=1 Tax=Pseudaquidulcibacter saccharophilus TaxID=2831900 RepID=UPI001EFF416F|nr:type I DNA topoisomerase [Pseudaquidulcibacter saccharophilus]
MQLVIVESPAKAKTINKYIGSDYDVIASFGHVRDLPSKDGSVDPEHDFAMHFEADARGKERIKEITEKVKKASAVILATDPDREGEAISWHIAEILKQKKLLGKVPLSRVTFNAITKQAVLEAMRNPREINQELVDAYLARRALDYLVGFELSPVLWRKLPGARSAGRVQSAALRLVVEREQEIEAFISEEYWSITASGKTNSSAHFPLRLIALNGKKLDKKDIKNEVSANAAVAQIAASSYVISSVDAKPHKRHPQPPFTTSTLQQEAARKLGFSAKRTMDVAQRLYEGVDIGGETVGLITYMRTDGVSMENEAIVAARAVIGREYGDSFVPKAPRQYDVKAKNAQEAHEAIRPTDMGRLPKNLRLNEDMAKLYDLIWKRAVASQMESALVERTTIDLEATDKKSTLRATGQVILFEGFLKLYQEGKDDSDDEENARLPKVNVGETANVSDIKPLQHFTEPPPRYSEATLVKKMEEIGIGRPSTYASTISVLQDREYIRLEKNRFHPEVKGRLVTAFLESFFNKYVQYDFTAGLEEQLDLVSNGELEYKKLLHDFYDDFHKGITDMADVRITQVIDSLNERLGSYLFPVDENGNQSRVCPTCGTGELSLKVSRYGAFTGCSNYPECKYTRQLGVSDSDAKDALATNNDEALGVDDKTGLNVYLRNGRFGPYVQLGEDPEKGSKDKPKRSTIPRGFNRDVTFDVAMELLSLPRVIGTHPDDGKEIVSNFGRFGPYILHDGTFANLKDANEVFEVGLNRAVTLLAEKRAGGGRGGRAAPAALKELGKNGDAEIKLMSGRYGNYVTDGTTNATLPKDIAADDLTLEIAIGLIEARAALGPAKKKTTRKTAAKKATTKKPATKKATATKATKTKAKAS